MSAPPTPLSDPATRLQGVFKGEIRRLTLKAENLREAASWPTVGLAQRLSLIARAVEALEAADALGRALRAASPPRPDLALFPRPLGVEGTQ